MADSDVEILDSDDDVEIISSSSSSDGGDVDLEDLASEASTRAPGSASSCGLSEDSFEPLISSNRRLNLSTGSTRSTSSSARRTSGAIGTTNSSSTYC